MAAARRAWRRKQRRLDPRQLVFIDETAVATNMVRRYGRAPRGQRLVCKVPFGAWTTLTFIAALRHDRSPPHCELAFNKLKARLRAATARSTPRLLTAVRAALTRFSPRECTAYLAHAGYRSI